MKKPSALLASDWHWREDIPKCRTDNYMEAQINKAIFAKEICNRFNIPLFIAGDVFDAWKSSPELLRIVLEYMPDFICIPGQHDLPKHNLDLFYKSNLAVLRESNKAKVILDSNKPIHLDSFDVYGFPYGIQPVSRRKRRNEKPSICMVHMQVSEENAMFETKDAYELLDELKGYDLILSGDNHKPFDIESNGRRLVNCGSVMRMDADQIDHEPRLYLWCAEDNSVEKVFIPIQKDVVVRTHLEIKKERDDRLDGYLDSMSQSYSIKLNFKSNINGHIMANKIEDDIKDIIFEWMEKPIKEKK